VCSGNKLTGTLPHELAPALEDLNLEMNRFVGPLPEWRNSKLKKLTVRWAGRDPGGAGRRREARSAGSGETGVAAAQLQRSPKHVLTRPVRLQSPPNAPSSNRLHGTLPAELLASSSSLEELRATSNRLIGTLPPAWARFSWLRVLDLRCASLGGAPWPLLWRRARRPHLIPRP
jgi:hypothetical protein